MEKFSNNWKKQQKNIRAIHASIKHMRNDYANQVSAKLTEQYGQIFIEDLAIRNMSQSAKGTADAPGKNVKAKTGLNRAILDQGWYRFRAMLEYKSARNGGQVIAINPQYTSQRCSVCGYIDAANRRTQAVFICQECGHAENADINAARNILQIGLELSVQTQKT
jgi:putative transposase